MSLWSRLKLNVKFTIIIITLVIIPIIGFSMILFQSMEENVLKDKRSSMEYNMNSSYDQILKNIKSINLSTQFFLSDQSLLNYLKQIKEKEPIKTEDLLQFYDVNLSFLERMVNNNPYLYQIRVYVDSRDMKEMMPVLYRKERMEHLAWAKEKEPGGWKYNYEDKIFDEDSTGVDKKIMSLITPISDYTYGELGTLEVAMSMETMFPRLYEKKRGEWNYFSDRKTGRFFGKNSKSISEKYLKALLKKMKGEESTATYDTKINGELVVIGYMPVKELSGALICVHSVEKEIGRIHFLRSIFFIIMLFVLGLLIILTDFIVKGLLKQLYSILNSIHQVQKGDLDVVIENCGTDEMGELGGQINEMLTRIRQLMEDNINREVLAKNSEIKALQNQINAHFIYNVLESIKMMAEIEEKYEISDAITILGKLLRYSMKWNSKNVTVKEEIEYIKNYLVLINLRFDYEIYLSLNVPEIILKQQIPKMSLQPVVENAIYHGIEQMAEDTNIYLKGIIGGEDCIIEITDAGKGMTEDEVAHLYRKLSGEVEVSGGSGNGIGLKNVQDRIKMSFGDNYGIEIASKLGCYTKVIMRIPLTEEKEGLKCEKQTGR